VQAESVDWTPPHFELSPPNLRAGLREQRMTPFALAPSVAPGLNQFHHYACRFTSFVDLPWWPWGGHHGTGASGQPKPVPPSPQLLAKPPEAPARQAQPRLKVQPRPPFEFKEGDRVVRSPGRSVGCENRPIASSTTAGLGDRARGLSGVLYRSRTSPTNPRPRQPGSSRPCRQIPQRGDPPSRVRGCTSLMTTFSLAPPGTSG